MDPFDNRAPLLARHVPLDEVVEGKVYVIHARNGGVGVAVEEKDGAAAKPIDQSTGGCSHLAKSGEGCGASTARSRQGRPTRSHEVQPPFKQV